MKGLSSAEWFYATIFFRKVAGGSSFPYDIIRILIDSLMYGDNYSQQYEKNAVNRQAG